MHAFPYLGTKARVSGDGNPERFRQLEQRLLRQIRVKFDLERLWLNPSVTHDIEDERSSGIAIRVRKSAVLG